MTACFCVGETSYLFSQSSALGLRPAEAAVAGWQKPQLVPGEISHTDANTDDPAERGKIRMRRTVKTSESLMSKNCLFFWHKVFLTKGFL